MALVEVDSSSSCRREECEVSICVNGPWSDELLSEWATRFEGEREERLARLSVAFVYRDPRGTPYRRIRIPQRWIYVTCIHQACA